MLDTITLTLDGPCKLICAVKLNPLAIIVPQKKKHHAAMIQHGVSMVKKM